MLASFVAVSVIKVVLLRTLAKKCQPEHNRHRYSFLNPCGWILV